MRHFPLLVLGLCSVGAGSGACGGGGNVKATSSTGQGTTGVGGSSTTGASGGATTSVSSGGAGGAEVYPAPHPAAPQVVDVGGPTLSSPIIVPIFFAGDDPGVVSELETFLGQLGPSSYAMEAGQEYGVGGIQVLPPIVLAETPPGTIDDADIRTWLAAKFDTNDPAFPAVSAGTLPVVFYPAGVTVTQGGAPSCGFYGYHESLTLDGSHGNQQLLYAIIARCGPSLEPLTQTTTHEIFEAATDPEPVVDPAYATLDDDHILWELSVGAEVGDLCDISPSFGKFPGVGFWVQRIWSNQQAAAGHDPCLPHIPGQVYFAAVPVLTDDVVVTGLGPQIHTKVASIAVGQTKTIDLALFSDAPTSAPWQVSVVDFAKASGNAPLLSLALDDDSGQNGDTLHLTIEVLGKGTLGYEFFYVVSSYGGQANGWVGVVSSN